MSVFRTLAAARVDGVAVTLVGTQISAVARTGGQAAGSWDLTMARPMPTGKVTVFVTPEHIAAHNLTPDYTWVDPSTLRVTLRDDTATLTDAAFSVEVQRCAV